ncbi:MAG: DinB family protein [Gemmatimonadales bacterium]
MTPTLPQTLGALLSRDLAAFRRTIAAFPDDRGPWTPVPGVPNTAGTLALHAAGNLRHFVGAALGGTGYVRDRAAEFARRDVSRAELVEGLEAAEREVKATLAALDPATLEAEHPMPPTGLRVTTADYLIHLATHLSFHLGQADTHRRAVTGDTASVSPVSVRELASARVSESVKS